MQEIDLKEIWRLACVNKKYLKYRVVFGYPIYRIEIENGKYLELNADVGNMKAISFMNEVQFVKTNEFNELKILFENNITNEFNALDILRKEFKL